MTHKDEPQLDELKRLLRRLERVEKPVSPQPSREPEPKPKSGSGHDDASAEKKPGSTQEAAKKPPSSSLGPDTPVKSSSQVRADPLSSLTIRTPVRDATPVTSPLKHKPPVSRKARGQGSTEASGISKDAPSPARDLKTGETVKLPGERHADANASHVPPSAAVSSVNSAPRATAEATEPAADINEAVARSHPLAPPPPLLPTSRDTAGRDVLPNSRALTRIEAGEGETAPAASMKVVIVSAVTAAIVASIAAGGMTVALLRPELLGLAGHVPSGPAPADTVAAERPGAPSAEAAAGMIVADAASGPVERTSSAAPASEASTAPVADTEATSREIPPVALTVGGEPGEPARAGVTGDIAEPARTVVLPELPRMMEQASSASSQMAVPASNASDVSPPETDNIAPDRVAAAPAVSGAEEEPEPMVSVSLSEAAEHDDTAPASPTPAPTAVNRADEMRPPPVTVEAQDRAADAPSASGVPVEALDDASNAPTTATTIGNGRHDEPADTPPGIRPGTGETALAGTVTAAFAPPDPPSPTGPPRIEAASELEIEAGSPTTLPLRISGAPELSAGYSVLLVGVPRGARLSRGTSLMFDTWQVPVQDISQAELTLAEGIAREIPIEVELRRPDGLAVGRHTLLLKTPGNPTVLGLTQETFARASMAVAKNSHARALTLRAERLIDSGDPLSARVLLEKAADAGAPLAAWMLALTYDPTPAAGLGVPIDATDAELAHRHYGRAAELGLDPR